MSLYPQLSIIAMQSVLRFMFWNTIAHMEDQLVPLNKVIENSPLHAKASAQCAGAAAVRCSPSPAAPQGTQGTGPRGQHPCSSLNVCAAGGPTSRSRIVDPRTAELSPSTFVSLMLQDLITHCTVVTEKQFKNVLQQVYKRKRRFKWASWDVKCAAGHALHETLPPLCYQTRLYTPTSLTWTGCATTKCWCVLPQFGDTASMQ